jgi:integrase/recombinase XerC
MTWQTDFPDYLASLGRAQGTISAYCSDIKVYVRWYEATNNEAFQPSVLVAPDLREWRYHSINVEKVNPATWNRRRISLIVFANWCMQEGFIQEDPLQGVNPMAIVELPPFWLNPDEFRRVRRHMDIAINTANTELQRSTAIRDRAINSLMLYAGLRVSEVVNLQREDLLLREKSGHVNVRCGKGDKFALELPLGKEARLALQAWMDIHQQEDGLLFEGLSARQIQRSVSDLGRAAKLEGALTPHRFRHTYIRRLSVDDEGKPVNPGAWVTYLARHSTRLTTERYYQASRDDHQRMVENM